MAVLLSAVLEDFTDALRDGLRERLVATPPAGPDRNADDFRATVRTFVEVVFDLIDEKGAGGWYLFGTVAPFALMGTLALLASRRREDRFLAAFNLAGCASLVAFFVLARYRLPCVPGLIVAAVVWLRDVKVAWDGFQSCGKRLALFLRVPRKQGAQHFAEDMGAGQGAFGGCVFRCFHF